MRDCHGPDAGCAHDLPEQVAGLLNAALLQEQQSIARPRLEACVIARNALVFFECLRRAAGSFERSRQEQVRLLIAESALLLKLVQGLKAGWRIAAAKLRAGQTKQNGRIVSENASRGGLIEPDRILPWPRFSHSSASARFSRPNSQARPGPCVRATLYRGPA